MITNKERDILQYNPTLRYIKDKINSPTYTVIGKADKIADYVNKLSSNTFLDIYDVLAEITRLMTIIETRYINSDKGIVDTIVFTDYKNALSAEANLETKILIDEYEHYQADYKGRSDLEVYPILVVLKKEWLYNLNFFKLMAMYQVQKGLPINLTPDSDEFKAYCALESANIETLYSKYLAQDSLENNLREMKFIDGDEYSALLVDINRLEDRMNSKVEAIDNMVAKINATKYTLSNIEKIINLVGSTEAKGIVKDSLAITPFNINEYTLVQLSLKSAIDAQLREMRRIEDERQAIANSDLRVKVNDDLIVATHIHNEVNKPLARTVVNLNEEVTQCNPILDTIAESIKQSREIYQLVLQSSYTLDISDKDMLNGKLSIIEKKHQTRYFYNVISSVVNYIDEHTHYPNEEELNNILDSV